MADGVTSLPPAAAASDSARGAAGDIRCPHCGHTTPRRPGTGAILDCESCDRSFAQPRPPSVSRRAPSQAGFDPILARSPTDVGMRLTGSVAFGITVLFYLGVVQPLSGTYFGELFGSRGWVPYVITWLSTWAAVITPDSARTC